MERFEQNIAAQFKLKFNRDITGFLGIQYQCQLNIPVQVSNSLKQKKITIKHGIVREGKQLTLDNLLLQNTSGNRRCNRIILGSSQKIEELIECADLSNARSKPTPFPTGYLLTPTEDKLPDKTKYRSLVGKLLWIASSFRPDIMFAVNQCAMYMNSPGREPLVAVKQIIR